jgi:hypothetical protein
MLPCQTTSLITHARTHAELVQDIRRPDSPYLYHTCTHKPAKPRCNKTLQKLEDQIYCCCYKCKSVCKIYSLSADTLYHFFIISFFQVQTVQTIGMSAAVSSNTSLWIPFLKWSNLLTPDENRENGLAASCMTTCCWWEIVIDGAIW